MATGPGSASAPSSHQRCQAKLLAMATRAAPHCDRGAQGATQRPWGRGLHQPRLGRRCPCCPPACHRPVPCHTPGLRCPSCHPLGPSPPSVTCQPLRLWWLSQRPWAHHRPVPCHPPGCHGLLSPPVTPQAVMACCPLLSPSRLPLPAVPSCHPPGCHCLLSPPVTPRPVPTYCPLWSPSTLPLPAVPSCHPQAVPNSCPLR